MLNERDFSLEILGPCPPCLFSCWVTCRIFTCLKLGGICTRNLETPQMFVGSSFAGWPTRKKSDSFQVGHSCFHLTCLFFCWGLSFSFISVSPSCLPFFFVLSFRRHGVHLIVFRDNDFTLLRCSSNVLIFWIRRPLFHL